LQPSSSIIEAQSCVLGVAAWQARQRAHEARVRAWTDPHQARTARGEKHPVYDFLFTYYSFRPAWLRQWHPGPHIVLAGEVAREFRRWPEYRENPEGVLIDRTALPSHRQEFVMWLRELLMRTQSRPAFFGCYGWHEWAMVYRQTPEAVRHNAWPMRFPPTELAAMVEGASICCSHFDAFRFFTPPSRPLNKVQPTRADALHVEQRGCLHANMDLYKWAFKLAPFAPSELTADCFELARDIREIDMRASPYDLRAIGFEPIAVETAAGRSEYEYLQRAFTARGEPLRMRLIALCEWLLGRSERGPGTDTTG
jgi:hypothetical protein